MPQTAYETLLAMSRMPAARNSVTAATVFAEVAGPLDRVSEATCFPPSGDLLLPAFSVHTGFLDARAVGRTAILLQGHAEREEALPAWPWMRAAFANAAAGVPLNMNWGARLHAGRYGTVDTTGGPFALDVLARAAEHDAMEAQEGFLFLVPLRIGAPHQTLSVYAEDTTVLSVSMLRLGCLYVIRSGISFRLGACADSLILAGQLYCPRK